MYKRKKKSKSKLRYIIAPITILSFIILGCTLFQNKENENPIPISSSERSEETSDKSEEGSLTVHFIDCGQGDAILVSVEEEGEINNALIDCGSYYNYDLVPDYLLNHGAGKLDYFFITHFDEDHAGAGSSVLKKIEVEQLVYKDTKVDSPAKYYLEKEISDEVIYHPKVCDVFALSKNCSFQLLAPLYEYESENNNSLVLKLIYEEKPILLLTGDAEEESELAMTKEYKEALYAPVLKVGHHGSKTSSSDEFLDMVNPSSVIISCKEKNEYFHPHASTLQKFRERGYEVYRTDEEGTIILEVKKGTMKFNVPPSNSWKAGEGE